MSAMLILVLLVVGVAATSEEQLFRWCAENKKCKLAYHIDTEAPHARDTFLYLLRLRVLNNRKGQTLLAAMLQGYGYDTGFELPNAAILQAHWIHFMLSQAPYCHTCADAVPQEAGVECGHGHQQLVYNASSKTLSCREKNQQSDCASDNGTERFHTSWWTDAAVLFLCGVLVVYGVTKSIQFSLRIREYSKNKVKE